MVWYETFRLSFQRDPSTFSGYRPLVGIIFSGSSKGRNPYFGIQYVSSCSARLITCCCRANVIYGYYHRSSCRRVIIADSIIEERPIGTIAYGKRGIYLGSIGVRARGVPYEGRAIWYSTVG